MKNLYKIQNELYIIDNNDKVTQNGIWARCSFTGDILKNRNGQNAYKVILTTNKLLIKDGVQAIDDEFLEWFVKNPSCEEVEVDKNWNYPLDKSWKYKIIIPKEEPKQQQDKNKFSEEDVEIIIQKLMNDVHCGDLCYGDNVIDFKMSPRQWFEQFSKFKKD
jgi:hypothetical protein